MPVIPSRFPVRFGDVFPMGCFALGIEPAMEFSEDSKAPRRQERHKETNLLLWTVRALDANEEVARFGAEFKVKVAAAVQPGVAGGRALHPGLLQPGQVHGIAPRVTERAQ